MDAGRMDAGRMDGGGSDGGTDAGFDAGVDAGFDGGVDAGFDAGDFDGGPISLTHLFPPRDFDCVPSTAPRPCATVGPVLDPAARTVVVTRDFAPTTRAWVLTDVRLPPVVSSALGDRAMGFNIDGIDSGFGSVSVSPTASCEELQPDVLSVYELGHVGVDNALATLVPTIESLIGSSGCPGGVTMGCLDAVVLGEINAGRFLLVLEVTGLQSYVHDDAVMAGLYLVQVPSGGSPVIGSSGRLAPGQTFSTVSVAAAPAAGDVFGGRLRVSWPSVNLPGMVGAALLPRTISPAELRGDIAAGTLTRAHLGGAVSVNDLVIQVSAIMPGIMATVRAVLESVADVDPGATPDICADLGAGLDLAGVDATRTP